MNRVRSIAFGRLAAVMLVLLVSTALTATTITITGQLSVPNPDLATQGAGPYADYTISSSDGTHWTVTATGINNFVFGDGRVFDLNISSGAGTVTFGSVTAITCLNGSGLISSGGNCDGLSSAGSGQVDGFGNLSFTLNDGSGFSNYDKSFTFTFTTQNARTAANLLTLNNKNADVAGHMALASNTGCTGYAANTGATKPTGSISNTQDCVPSTPEPAGMTLLTAGILALAGLTRRRLRG